MTIIFGRTQQAIETPFIPNRNPGFGGVPSDIESLNVQDAIEEAKQDALNNDRYLILCSYGGNANSGRTMEAFPGIDMTEAPVFLPVASRLMSLVVGSTSSSTCTISFYNRAVSTVAPVFSTTLSSQKRKVLIGTTLAPIALFVANTELEVRVSSGSIQKPHIYFFLSAST